MKPLVSVVIPTFNRSKKLKALLNSIKASSYKNLEIIVVNNGGENFRGKIPTKVIELTENKGLAFARNAGAKVCKGKYVLFADDDNILEKDCIAFLVHELEHNSSLFAVGPVTYYASERDVVWFLSVSIDWFTLKPRFAYTVDEVEQRIGNLVVTENLHNCFMMRTIDGERNNWFDESLFLGGTELDFFMKSLTKDSFLATCTSAVSWHDIPSRQTDLVRSLGFSNKKRVYYFQRNRAKLILRYASSFQKYMFFIFFYPVFFFAYSLFFVIHGKWRYFIKHVQATVDGYLELL